MGKLIIPILATLVVVFFLLPILVEAAGLVPCGGCKVDLNPATGQCPAGEEQSPCNLCHLFQLIKNILDVFLFPITPVIATLFFTIGGFMLFAAAGNPANVGRAKTIILATIIGLLVIYASWAFLNMFLDIIGVSSWTGLGGWWTITCG